MSATHSSLFFFKRKCDYLLCLVPHIHVPQELLGPGGQVELEGEAEHFVNGAQEVQAALDLLLDLEGDTHTHTIYYQTRLTNTKRLKVRDPGCMLLCCYI